MKFDEIISLAYDCNCIPETCTAESLLHFAMNLISIERDRCATVLEEKLYPNPKTDYQQQYNDGLLEDINKIKHPESYAS